MQHIRMIRPQSDCRREESTSNDMKSDPAKAMPTFCCAVRPSSRHLGSWAVLELEGDAGRSREFIRRRRFLVPGYSTVRLTPSRKLLSQTAMKSG